METRLVPKQEEQSKRSTLVVVLLVVLSVLTSATIPVIFFQTSWGKRFASGNVPIYFEFLSFFAYGFLFYKLKLVQNSHFTIQSTHSDLTQPDIVKADKHFRIKVIFIVVILLGVYFGPVAMGLAHLRDYLLSWAMEVPDEIPNRLVLVAQGATVFRMSFIIAVGIYCIIFGKKILAYGQIPLPGRRVIFDTQIVRGDEARKKGRIFVVVGVFVILLGLGVIVFSQNYLHV